MFEFEHVQELVGTNEDDILLGSNHGGSHANNTIYGNGGDDFLNGHGGNDTLNGGTGNDTLTGGWLTDTYVFEGANFGNDTIRGFGFINPSNTSFTQEKIVIGSGSGFSSYSDVMNHASQQGADVLLSKGGNSVTVASISLTDLSANSFEFI